MSSSLTFSALAQNLAFAVLGVQLFSTGSAAGISAKSLAIEGFALCLRLSATVQLDGYLPADKTGDFAYQAIEVVSVVFICLLLLIILLFRRGTYQSFEDSFRVFPLVAGAFVLGFFLHGDMDDAPTYDTLWMTALFLNTVAVIPQYWLLTQTGDRADSLMCHYFLLLATGRILSGIFMWIARNHMTCIPYLAGFQHTICAIFIAHVLHLLCLGEGAHYFAFMASTRAKHDVFSV
jgi:hypothetical protein